jgi:hypothetical protein
MENIIKASSPIYLVRSHESCWKCGRRQEVIALAARHLEETDPEPLHEGDEPVLFENMKEMPKEILEFVTRVHPHYEKRTSRTAESTYYMNTCDCGAHFGDFYLHSEPGHAFFPMSEEEAYEITIQEIPFTGKFEFLCSYGLGTGSFIFENARKAEK